MISSTCVAPNLLVQIGLADCDFGCRRVVIRLSNECVSSSSSTARGRPFHCSWSTSVRPAEELCSSQHRGAMSDTRVGIESRRSARVPLKVVILAQGLTEPITCEGEIIVVNRHGALISTSVSFARRNEDRDSCHSDEKRAPASAVYVDLDRLRVCGIGLVEPENIWRLALPSNHLTRSTSTNEVQLGPKFRHSTTARRTPLLQGHNRRMKLPQGRYRAPIVLKILERHPHYVYRQSLGKFPSVLRVKLKSMLL